MDASNCCLVCAQRVLESESALHLLREKYDCSVTAEVPSARAELYGAQYVICTVRKWKKNSQEINLKAMGNDAGLYVLRECSAYVFTVRYWKKEGSKRINFKIRAKKNHKRSKRTTQTPMLSQCSASSYWD